MCTTKKAPERPTVAVVGAGAAGMMAAVAAARAGAQVLLLERNGQPGRKLRITGKGRCNLTNDCTREEFLTHVTSNPRFLYAALTGFSTADAKDFFEELGVPLKTERGRRVFPVSDRAADVVAALERACRQSGVRLLPHARVRGLELSGGLAAGVRTDGGLLPADAVIVCTGGLSYPGTGSDGDGYALARQAGHTVVPPRPSLVPLVEQGGLCASMQGLSLRNTGLRVTEQPGGRCVYEDFGELLFTHFGLSGPMALSASAHLGGVLPGRYTVCLDLKPALDAQRLDARVLSDFARYRNRDFGNALGDLLPQKMISPVIAACGIDPRKKVNAVTRAEREALVRTLKCLCIPLAGLRPISEAIVTRGGVDVREISPKTMESRRVPRLYFAGEVLDVDACTGGFNLQIAFSTGVAAGRSAAEQSPLPAGGPAREQKQTEAEPQ